MSNNITPLPPAALPSVAAPVQILDGAAADDALAALARLKSEEQIIEFTPFPEGGYFKYGAHKGHPPQCIVVDAAGINLCIARNTDIAEFICNSCNCFVIASLMNKVQDSAIVEPGSPLILPGGATPTVFES